MRPRVLVVDDDTQSLSAVKRLLKPNFDVEGCPTAEEVLQAVRDGTLDLALIEVRLPNHDGLSLLDLILRHRADVAVVMCTNRPEPEVVVSAMKRGASDFLTKPLDDAAELATRLNSAVMQARGRQGIYDLIAQLESDSRPLPRYTDARQLLMSEFQKRYLERLMRASKGNLSAASRLSGIDRANLRRALQKHNHAR